MSEWKEKKLGDLAEITSSKRIYYSDYVPEGIRFYRSKEIIEKSLGQLNGEPLYISKEKFYDIKNQFGSPVDGDLLISAVGERAGVPFVVKDLGDFYFKDGNLIWLRNIKADLDIDFFCYWLKSSIGQMSLDSIMIGSAQKALTIVGLKGLNIIIPNIKTQRAIASILSSLDDKIDLLHRQNQTLEKMAETLFRQWFVEEAKEDWEEGTLGEAIEIYDSLRIPLSKMERDLKKDGYLYPYYGAAQIMDYINDYIFDGEYILLGEDGTVRTDEGFPILQYATGKFWVNNHTHVIKAKEPYNNFFIWNYLSKKNIDEIVTGAVQPKINQGNLKSLDFLKFPRELVKKFNNVTESFFKKINQNKIQILTLSTLRDTLLPKLMSGEVRVEILETKN